MHPFAPAAWLISTHFSLGVEVRAVLVMPEVESVEHGALYAGLTLGYRTERFWRGLRLGDRERDLITRYVVTMSELRAAAPPSARAAEPDAAAAGVGPLGQPQVDTQLR